MGAKWRIRVSIPVPRRCERRTLPIELIPHINEKGPRGNRTPDLLHPNQESHRLEAIAERLGVIIVGRHTALGDAFVTGEVFLKMVPLLAEMGIHTLGQAREAAEKTYYARVQY